MTDDAAAVPPHSTSTRPHHPAIVTLHTLHNHTPLPDMVHFVVMCVKKRLESEVAFMFPVVAFLNYGCGRRAAGGLHAFRTCITVFRRTHKYVLLDRNVHRNYDDKLFKVVQLAARLMFCLHEGTERTKSHATS